MTRDTGGGTAGGSETGIELTVGPELSQGTAEQEDAPPRGKRAACAGAVQAPRRRCRAMLLFA